MKFPLWLVSIAIALEILAPAMVRGQEATNLSELDNKTGILVSHRRYRRYRYIPRRHGRGRVYRRRHYRVYSPRHRRYSHRKYRRRKPSIGIFIRF